ncbi:hypothetical protein J6590_054778 [Homalodisca vitripennis]|nr:hypothetical protein J6590_054778 [Homalodisca vitripennis]
MKINPPMMSAWLAVSRVVSDARNVNKPWSEFSLQMVPEVGWNLSQQVQSLTLAEDQARPPPSHSAPAPN